MIIDVLPLSEPLRSIIRKPPEEAELYWLGQAGFLFRSPDRNWIVDPYLSNHLGEKYRDTVFSHQRMMPPPLQPDELPEVDFVFCTHSHGDHLDGPTLQWLASNRPRTRFVLPAGIVAEAAGAGLPADRVIWAKSDEPLALDKGFDVVPIPAAHEQFEYDLAGNHRFLGYTFLAGPFTFYHSGDSIPYDGLNQRLMALNPDLALLPVNGRRQELSERKIAGNFFLSEAIDLCRHLRIPFLIAHHFGMFAFNTIKPELIDEAVKNAEPSVTLLKARAGVQYRLRHG